VSNEQRALDAAPFIGKPLLGAIASIAEFATDIRREGQGRGIDTNRDQFCGDRAQ
jgi:hypothetical protein